MDIKLAVEELNGITSRELNNLLKDSENFTIQLHPFNGASNQIDMERLASSLPLHLIAILLSDKVSVQMAHLLRGFRLLYSLVDLASKHSRLEQILLDDVKVSEQILDLIFYALIILGSYNQETHIGTSLPLLHVVLVACSLHLLTGYISPQWQDLAHVLLAHPKVDIFMDVAFDALHAAMKFLNIMLLAFRNDVKPDKSSRPALEGTIHYFCQQCEASLQFLMFLCQQKVFRDRLLKNKELCRNGGILSLANTIINLNPSDCFNDSLEIVATLSRLKAKILFILLQLCEAESISYLDEVAGSVKSMHLGKSVALEVLNLLKCAFERGGKQFGKYHIRGNPKGLVLLNALRLADIFSDDSNFRSFFMTNTIPVLVEILSIPNEAFINNWCSISVPIMEEDANVDYDPFMAAGVALDSLSNQHGNFSLLPVLIGSNIICPNSSSAIPLVTYAQHRTSYLVKIIANLHCFVPNICEEEERDLFLNKFHMCLLMDSPEPISSYPLTTVAAKPAAVCENLGSLSDYATSLIPNLLNDEDVQLLSLFSKQLLELLSPQIGDALNEGHSLKDEGSAENYYNARPHQQDAQSTAGDAAPKPRKTDQLKFGNRGTNFKWEITENAFIEEVSQVGVKHETKPKAMPGRFGFEHKTREDLTTRDSSCLLRPSGREVHEVETNSVDMELVKVDPDLISDTGEFFKIEEFVDDRGESAQSEEKQIRKRKRNIMNDMQVLLIEKALSEEPEMQKSAASLQSWADKLSIHGSELTASQLKNWLNNRKAKLARAARDIRPPFDMQNSYTEKPIGSISHFYDSPETSAGEDYCPPLGESASSMVKPGSRIPRLGTKGDGPSLTIDSPPTMLQNNGTNSDPVRAASFEPGDSVFLVDGEGNNIGRGKVFQVEGWWNAKSISAGGTCVVDITELKIESRKGVPYPSEAAGMTFDEAAARNCGIMRVAWDANRLSRVT